MGGCCYRETLNADAVSIERAKGQQGIKKIEKRVKGNHESPKRCKRRLKTYKANSASQEAFEEFPDLPKSRSRSKSRKELSLGMGEFTSEPCSAEQSPHAKEHFNILTTRLKKSLDTKYSIKQVLSKGMLFAQHRNTQLMRIIRKIAKSKEGAGDALRAEIELLRKIDHPHVLQFSEILISKTHFFVVSEPLVGCKVATLESIFQLNSEQILAQMIRELLQVINHCRLRGIIHRKLDTRNLVFLETGEGNYHIKVMGFGEEMEQNCEMVGNIRYYAAPEVLFDGNYSEKSDVWSCGVISYLFLTKILPFSISTKEEFLLSVEKPLPFAPSQRHQYSNELLTLVRCMLEPKIQGRWSAAECLTHPYMMRLHSQSDNGRSSIALGRLKTFTSTSQFKIVILGFFSVHVLSMLEKQSFISVFSSLDLDQDGVLSKSDLAQAYSKSMSKDVAELVAARIIESMDQDNNGGLTFSSFLVTAIDQSQIIDDQNLRLIFQLLDCDGLGHLPVSQLKTTLQCANSNEIWDQLLRKVETRTNGRLSAEEFAKLMQVVVEYQSS